MILDAVIIGGILVGCALVSIAGYKKFQPSIERELEKSERQHDVIRTKTKSRS